MRQVELIEHDELGVCDLCPTSGEQKVYVWDDDSSTDMYCEGCRRLVEVEK